MEKSQYPNNKFQINFNDQISKGSEVMQRVFVWPLKKWQIVLNFGYWNLERIWDLVLEVCRFPHLGSWNKFQWLKRLLANLMIWKTVIWIRPNFPTPPERTERGVSRQIFHPRLCVLPNILVNQAADHALIGNLVFFCLLLKKLHTLLAECQGHFHRLFPWNELRRGR